MMQRAWSRLVRLSVAACCLLSCTAWAGPSLDLDEQARSAVPNDEMVIILATERDGPQVGPLNEAVLTQLNAAIAEARKTEGVRARLGSISTQPNYTRDGKPQGWRVRGEVVLESQKMPALGQLGSRLGERMQLASVQFRLSSERRRAEEQRLLREVAQSFRDKAAQAARAFGYQGYDIKSLSLQPGRVPPPRPVMMSRASDAGLAAAPPVPEEGGDSEVVVSVSGTVIFNP